MTKDKNISSFDDIAGFAADFTGLCEETEEVVERDSLKSFIKLLAEVSLISFCTYISG